MALMDYLLGQRKKKTATAARDRLHILLAQERSERNAPDYLPQMRNEILEVISKYVNIDQDQLKISIDEDNGMEVLELNLVLPDGDKK
ncbi:cell division topological specificity factor MinE [Thiomicrorhabdus indica]|uniref:cell division topological specificity factor MinE n=1 Tax=Thiomicrorhabdus indica TaxID=2267253 RepID=UPI00102DE029|nr:cell division topological specificity factor MinE [Thiomicrorhabdus indica]